MRVRIEDWSVFVADPWKAPEINKTCLQGKVYGHPRFDDGHSVKTGDIAAVNGRVVTTKNGTVYELGEINPEYREWLDTNGYVYDHENPIAIGRGKAKRKSEHRA